MRISRPSGLAALITALAVCASGPAFAAGPPQPIDSSFPYVRSIRVGVPACDTCPPRVCPSEAVPVSLSGELPPCVHYRGVRELPVASAFPVYQAEFVVDSCGLACDGPPVPFADGFMLPARGPGPGMFVLQAASRVCPDTSAIARTTGLSVNYLVEPDCPHPIPVDSLVRTFASYRILPEWPCPGDSLVLEFAENGCPPCLTLDALTLTRVRGFVGSMNWRPGCLEFACMSDTVRLGLGRFAAGSHELRVVTDVHVLDTQKADSVITFGTAVRFEVGVGCDSTVGGCVAPELPGIRPPKGYCAVVVRPGGRGDAAVPTFSTLVGRSVAGVEGFLGCPRAFRIVDVRYGGVAAGVHVSWRQDGALTRFVLFNSTGGIIPTGISDLLRVTVEADSVLPPGVIGGAIQGQITLISDPAGVGILPCKPDPFEPPYVPLCIDRTAQGCDANADGRLDVRDLVLMAHCLDSTATGAWDHSVCFDCDADGTFGIPDLFCCAYEVLHGPGVSRDRSRVQPGLVVSLDPPVADGAILRLRVRVQGADALGAALLRLRYPADAWQVRLSPRPGPSSDRGWLPLADGGEAGLLRVGALRLSDVASGELVADLEAVPLGSAGPGILTIEGADLTTSEGTVLLPSAPLPSVSLGSPGPPVVALGKASPNPFNEFTRFSVALPKAAVVDLSVHDVAGRRVATLVQGVLPAGQHDHEWRGAGLHDGIYFVRLTVDGRVWSSRVVLLRHGH